MMKKILNMKKQDKRGFTLVETLVAVAILALAIAGPMYSANVALVAAQVAGQELTASYLAQEGIEYVRATRDYEYLHDYVTNGGDTSDAWHDFLSKFTANKTYTVDPSRDLGGVTGAGLALCSGSSCKPLRLQSTGLYTQATSAGVPTPYMRTVQMTPVSTTEESIVSVVTWTYHDQSHTVTVRDNLTAWQ